MYGAGLCEGVARAQILSPDIDNLPKVQPITPPQAPEKPDPFQGPAIEPLPEIERPADDNSLELDEPIDDIAIPEIQRDLEILPFPVRRMRELLLEATHSGDIEQLRPLLGLGENVTLLSFGENGEDPIDFLREASGDREGHEILAILQEVLEMGYVHLDPGEETELYVWPYFWSVPLDKLDSKQKVELFRLITAGDFEDMEAFGSYIFYRAGITPEGRLQFFVAGD